MADAGRERGLWWLSGANDEFLVDACCKPKPIGRGLPVGARRCGTSALLTERRPADAAAEYISSMANRTSRGERAASSAMASARGGCRNHPAQSSRAKVSRWMLATTAGMWSGVGRSICRIVKRPAIAGSMSSMELLVAIQLICDASIGKPTAASVNWLAVTGSSRLYKKPVGSLSLRPEHALSSSSRTTTGAMHSCCSKSQINPARPCE